MKNCVFCAADIQIDRQPLLQEFGIGKCIVVERVDVAQIVPAATGPLRHRVRLAHTLLARCRIDHVHPLARAGKRRLAASGGLVVLQLGKRKRQIVFRNERLGSIFPVDDRERLAPVALAREKPVAKLVLGLRFAYALFLEVSNHLLLGFLDRKAIDKAGIDHHARLDVGKRRLGKIALSIDDLNHRNRKLLREFVIAIVMGGNGHDRARAVGRKDIIGDIDGKLIAIDGIDAAHALKLHAGLVLVHLRALKIALARSSLAISDNFIGIGKNTRLKPLRHQLVLGAYHHVCRTEKRVAARRVDGNDIFSRLEIDERTGGLANPVALHLLDAFRPVKRIEIF